VDDESVADKVAASWPVSLARAFESCRSATWEIEQRQPEVVQGCIAALQREHEDLG